MGLLTYNAKFGDKDIRIKAKKEVAQRFTSSLKDLFRITHFTRELTGIIGVAEGWNKESSHVMMSLGLPSGHALPDPEGYAKDLEAFKTQVPTAPAVIEGERLKELWQAAVDLLNKHMPVNDRRETPEQADASRAEMKKLDEQREVERNQKKQENEKSSEYVKQYPFLVPIARSGKSSHAAGSANIKAELERNFPGVAFSVKSDSFSGGNSIDVKWTDGPTVKQVKNITDKYSYGSFDGMTDSYNYADDRVFCNTFGGAKYVHESREVSDGLMIETAAAMEQTFTPEQWKEFEATAHQYPESAELLREIRNRAHKTPKVPAVSSTAAPAPVSDGNVTVRMNPELNGVEILFSAKPDQTVILGLKAHGFRWSPKGKLWYAKQSDSRISFAYSLQKQEIAA